MTRQHAAKEWPVMKAFAEGAKLESKVVDGNGKWYTTDDPIFSDSYQHRVKPKPVDEAELRKLADYWSRPHEFPVAPTAEASRIWKECGAALENVLDGAKVPEIPAPTVCMSELRKLMQKWTQNWQSRIGCKDRTVYAYGMAIWDCLAQLEAVLNGGKA